MLGADASLETTLFYRYPGDLFMPRTTEKVSAPEREPIGPFLHYLMSECGVSPNTLAAYRSDLMRFVRWRKASSTGPLAALDVPALSGYVESLNRAGLAPSSVSRHLASLSTFFRFLVFEGRLADNVAKLLVAPALWERLPTVLSPAAVDQLLESPRSETRLGRRDRACLETLYATGCRASEVVGLEPSRPGPEDRIGTVRGQGEQGASCSTRLARHRGTNRLSAPRPSAVRGPTPRNPHGLRLEVGPSAFTGRPLANRQTACPDGRLAR